MGNTSSATEAAESSFNGYLGLALTLIFAVLFIAFVAEICYLVCRKTKLITINNPVHHTYTYDTTEQLTGATSSSNSVGNLDKSSVSINSPTNHQLITLQQHFCLSSASPSYTTTELAEITNSVQVITNPDASTGAGSIESASEQALAPCNSNRNPSFYVFQLSPIMEETRDDISQTTASCRTTPSPSPALNQTVQHRNNRLMQIPTSHNSNSYYYVSSPSPNLQPTSPLLSPYAARAAHNNHFGTPSPVRSIINYIPNFNSLSSPSPPSDHLSPYTPVKHLHSKDGRGVSLGFLFQMSPNLLHQNSDTSNSSRATDDHITTHSPLTHRAQDHKHYSCSLLGKTQKHLHSINDMLNHDNCDGGAECSCTVSSPSAHISQLPGCLRSSTAPPRQGRHRHNWILSFIFNR